MQIDIRCYVIVAQTYTRYMTEVEYVKAYLNKRSAEEHVAGMQKFKSNEEEFSIVETNLCIEMNEIQLVEVLP